MIMLEGPDLAGKTTLARKLHAVLRGSEIVHRGPPASNDPFAEYLKPLEEMYYEERWPILDRWHWGEMIYGPKLRGGSMMDVTQLEYIEMACMRYGVSRLMLLPPLGVLLQRFDEHGDDLVEREQLIQIAEAYEQLEYDPDYSVHRIFDACEEWSRPNINVLVIEATTYRQRAQQLISWPSYVGPRLPKVLFIGERPAESHLGKHKTAFVPYRGTSGHHLMTCLRRVQARDVISPNDTWLAYGFVNAYDGCDDFPGLWETLGRPRVVALGKLAHEAIYRYGVGHGRAPHPQFARRFHNKKRDEYGGALLLAVNGEDMSKWKG